MGSATVGAADRRRDHRRTALFLMFDARARLRGGILLGMIISILGNRR